MRQKLLLNPSLSLAREKCVGGSVTLPCRSAENYAGGAKSSGHEVNP